MHPDAALARLASRQYSVFTRRQALDAGISAAVIQGRLDAGLWQRMHNGVYLPAAVAVGWEQRVIGACLACGPYAAASFSSAARVWSFDDDFRVPDVSIPGTKVRRRPGITVHRADDLEVVSYRGLAVTPPRRTLLDLAAVVDEASLERYLDDAHRRGLIDPAAFARYLALHRRPAVAVLRELVAMRQDDAVESAAETLLARALRAAGLPRPVTQHPVATRRGRRFIDFAYPEEKVAIEVDGWTNHGARSAFEADRIRQNELVELGWFVLRFTWAQLTRDPVGVAVSVGIALGLRPSRWRPTA